MSEQLIEGGGTMFMKGDRVELVSMRDDPWPIPVGTHGTVIDVNDCDLGENPFTQISVRWDNGRKLMVCVPPDELKLADPRCECRYCELRRAV